MTAPLQRDWTPAWPCPVTEVWSAWRRGSGDPTYRVDASGRHWRALLTPAGPATLRVASSPADGVVTADAWGPGAEWVLDALPAMLGAGDDPSGFVPRHEALARAAHAHPHWRVGRGGVVWEALVRAVLEQKVTGSEATAGFRALVRRFGSAAPGPAAASGLRLLPTPDAVRRVPSWEWLRLGVDPARSATLVRAAARASALERTLAAEPGEVDALLRAIPGIGVWTSAEVRARAHGDPDAVSFGDYHVARSVGWALVGRELDDDGLAELLEPYRGHRLRVQRLVELSRLHHPRYGPRLAPRTHLPG